MPTIAIPAFSAAATRRSRFAVRPVSLVAVLTVFVVVGVAGCGNAVAPAGNAANPASTVRMSEFKFVPADLTVPANSTLTLINDGKVSHSYLLRGQGIGTGEIQPGKSGKLLLQGVAAGTYQVYCDVPGHAAAGETGTLTVAP